MQIQIFGTAPTPVTPNSFITWLSSNHPTVWLTTPGYNPLTSPPQNTYPMCQSVWISPTLTVAGTTTPEGGTCCNTIYLQTLFQTYSETSKKRWEAFSNSLYIFSQAIPQMTNILNTDLAAAVIAMLAATGEYDFGGLLSADILALYNFIPNYPTGLAAFKVSAPQCFAEGNAIRAKLWCFGCWAYSDSQLYIVSNGVGGTPPNFKVSMAATDTLLVNLFSACGPAWEFAFRVTTMLNIVSQLAKYRQTSLAPLPSNSNYMFNNVALATPMKLAYDAFTACSTTTYAITGVCTLTHMQNLVSLFHSWAGNERVLTPLREEPNFRRFRRLQYLYSDSALVFSAAPAIAMTSFASTTTYPTTTATLDVSAAGNPPVVTTPPASGYSSSYSNWGSISWGVFGIVGVLYFGLGL